MTRTFLSRPVQQLLADGLLDGPAGFFDYGCGRGGDVRHLREMGMPAAGWDPAHAPDEPLVPSAVVNLGFVVNVIEDHQERRDALHKAWALAQEVLVVSARMDWEAPTEPGRPFRDGFLTKTGTFQKFFRQDELRAWIDSTLDQKSVAAAPGIFYVFRSAATQQHLLSRLTRTGGSRRTGVAELVLRHHKELLNPLVEFVASTRRLPNPAELDQVPRLLEVFGSVRSAFSVIRRVPDSGDWSDIEVGARKSSEARFEANLTVLQPLIDFLRDRGRLPRDGDEFDSTALTDAFGSVRAAYSLVRRVAGADVWTDYEARARTDFLVYLALAAFGGRPKFTDLPADLQNDTRDFFGSYKEATAAADQLLFTVGKPEAVDAACRESGIGKLTPEALYVHVAALPVLPAALRVYAGCGQALTGRVEEATILKLHRQKPQVSFLSYPRFDADAHPALATSIVARLRELNVSYKDFSQRDNPPILHRKETFVSPDYPGRPKFAALTAKEERLGLLDSPTIGTRVGWEAALRDAGWMIRGHQVREL
ncbi:MAG: DNA phosphorothioation-associated putative methyltransferase [Actinobacteria bacterium]|nr:DNA phosphorothioation-associated putative methyltransferase [Actinomycetota bacterium]